MAVIIANTTLTLSVPAGFRLQFGTPISGTATITLPDRVLTETLTDGEGLGPYQSDASIAIQSTVGSTCYTIRRDGPTVILQSAHLWQVPFLPGVSVFIGESASGPSVPAGWYGTSYASVSGAGNFYPNMPTYEAIQAAAQAARDAGGGFVHLPPVEINLGGRALPLYSGVIYEGVPPVLRFLGNIPDQPPMVAIGGSRLVGNGTVPGFAGNDVDRAGPFVLPSTSTPDQSAFSNTGLTGCGVRNVAVTGATYAIKLGGNYNPGAFYSEFYNVIAIDCTDWGFWFENMIHVSYDRLYAYGCGYTASQSKVGGQMMFMSSSQSTVLQPGNSRIGEICATTNSNNLFERGIEISAKNTTIGGIGQSSIIQANRFGNNGFTQAVTVSAAGTVATVADGSKLCVGMPVAFTASTVGLNLLQVYIVKTVAGNDITLATTTYGAAVALTVGTATLTCQGFPCLSAYGQSAGDTVGLGAIDQLDLEAGGTTKCLLQNVMPGSKINAISVARDSSSTVDISIRGSQYLDITAVQGAYIDADASSVMSRVTGIVGQFTNAKLQMFGQYAGDKVVNLAQSWGGSTPLPTFVNRAPGNGMDFTYPGVPVGVRTGYSPNANATWNNGSGISGLGVYTGSGTTWTWAPGLSAALKGFRQTFKNRGTGALVITLGASDGSFDGMTGGTSAGKSMTLAAPTTTTPGGCLTIVCAQSGASTYEWEIESMVNAALV